MLGHENHKFAFAKYKQVTIITASFRYLIVRKWYCYASILSKYYDQEINFNVDICYLLRNMHILDYSLLQYVIIQKNYDDAFSL